jgi:ELWxxDGT repeat protein
MPRCACLLTSAALALGLLATAIPAAAQPAFLVKDLNSTASDPSAGPAFFATLPGLTLFSSYNGATGYELWASDGTDAGTRQVKDICPGICWSYPQELTAVGSTLYFAAHDGAGDAGLWKSDGTEAGTLLVDYTPPGLPGSGPSNLVSFGGTLYFTATDGSGLYGLWRSDGTAAGTTQVRPGLSPSQPQVLAVLGDTLFFQNYDFVHGDELWKTDGTAAGTGLVQDINPGSAGSLPPTVGSPGATATVFAGKLYFAAADGAHGTELWVSDGTGAGTHLVQDIEPGAAGSSPTGIVAANGALYFAATDAGGTELWVSDGTGAGTHRVKDIRSGVASSSPSQLTAAAGLLFFLADDGTHGTELWASDGTEGGTHLVKDIAPGFASGLDDYRYGSFVPTALGGALVFYANDGVHGAEPWTSDGTDAGTVLLADLYPGGAGSGTGSLDVPPILSGRLIFGALTATGSAIFATDGTPAGTARVRQMDVQASAFQVSIYGRLSGSHPLADLSGTLLFPARTGTADTSLARSDGTADGTALVVPSSGPVPEGPQQLTAAGGTMLFTAFDPVHGLQLWGSDGTPDGTRLVKDFTPGVLGDDPVFFDASFLALGGKVFFYTYPRFSSFPQSLAVSDGTPEGTVPLTPSSVFLDQRSRPVAVGGRVYFGARGTSNELWQSDGTPAGTVPVFEGAIGDLPPLELTAVGRLVFFVDYVHRRLWVSDGTQAGTHQASGSAILADPPFSPELDGTRFAGAGGRLFFLADDGIHGEELWVSDGTDAGTAMVKDILPGAAPSGVRWLTAVGQRVFFVAEDGVHGRELWISDGTSAGTHLVADVFPGRGSSVPMELAAIDGKLLFTATDGVHGREPWVSDGTAAGTAMIQDIAPGALSSSPLSFTVSGQNVYFAANDNSTGFELWALPRAALSPALDFFTVTPCRLFDTRQGAVLVSGQAQRFAVAGSCGIPETARAVAANVTVVARAHGGHVTAYPAFATVPTSTLNFGPFQTRANNAVIPLTEGSVETVSVLTGGGGADLILDVFGYFE